MLHFVPTQHEQHSPAPHPRKPGTFLVAWYVCSRPKTVPARAKRRMTLALPVAAATCMSEQPSPSSTALTSAPPPSAASTSPTSPSAHACHSLRVARSLSCNEWSRGAGEER
eukprot:2529198-Rhodomonas_salina.2